MAVYGYARVSTDKQATEGESLDVQQRKLQGWCLMQGEEMAHLFVDRGVSGSTPIHERPEGGAMLKALKAGDTLVATKLDRVFRSSLDALQTIEVLRKRKVRVWLLDLGEVTGNGIAKVFMTIAAAFAEFERERIAERVTDTKRDQRDRGLFLGGKWPFGFSVRYELDGDKKVAVMEPVPAEQRIIADIRKLRGNGSTLRAIQGQIEQQHGRRISLATLKRLVSLA